MVFAGILCFLGQVGEESDRKSPELNLGRVFALPKGKDVDNYFRSFTDRHVSLPLDVRSAKFEYKEGKLKIASKTNNNSCATKWHR